jgi:hypothetical protein
MGTLINGKPTDPLLIRTTVPDLTVGEGKIRNTSANFAQSRNVWSTS